VSKKQKKLSLAGGTMTSASAAHREMDALASHLCEQVEFLQGLCRTLGIFAYADDRLDGLSVKDIGNTALLMGQSLDDIHEGLEKIESLAGHSCMASHI
jgi:hypothetical protein